ncbi:hypothetical protein [Amycolatopsis magusensis]|uniref:hypothetical protein n=1 Tax=Amycolatopsis magusensis TaxID=882444 RepID=UPI003C301E34
MTETDGQLIDSPYVSETTKKHLIQASTNPLNSMVGGEDYETVRSRAVSEMNNGLKTEETTAKHHGELSAQQPPGPNGSGVAKSDEVLDLAKPALDFFSTWIDRVWNNVPGASRLEYLPEVWDRFHQNRDIDFRKLSDEAEEFTRTREVVEQTMEAAKSELNTLFGAWEGAGAAAARTKYQEGIVPDAQKLLDQLEGAAKLIPETAAAIYQTLKQQVDEVLLLNKPTIAGADVETATRIARVAPGGSDSNDDDFMAAARFFDSQYGTAFESGLNDLSVTAPLLMEALPQTCEVWLLSFKDEFAALFESFKNLCDQTNKTVDGQWYALVEFMSDFTNEFTDAAAAPAPQTAPQQSGPLPGDAGPAMTGGGPSAMPAGGTGGAPSMPAPPPPAAPPMPAAPETAAAPEKAPAEEPEKNPVTGGELELDPETGEAYPIDPLTGEAVKEAAGPALTVEKGDSKLSFSEPDADGKLAITVEGPSGEPKDFQLAFDGEETEDETLRPGEDGRIQFEDGPLKITAERPDGPGGPTLVEVDDGSGEPTKYVLGEQAGEAAPQSSQWTEPEADTGQSTSAQSVGSGDFLSSGAAAVGLGAPAPDSGLGDTTASAPGAAPSGIGLGSTPGGAAAQPNTPSSQDPAAAGMGMMGGMGGGAGGGNSGDTERAPNQYRHSGSLFDTPAPANRISGTLDDEDDGLIGFGR